MSTINTSLDQHSNYSVPENATELSIDDVLHLTIVPVITVGKYVHLVWYAIGFVGNVISAKIWNAKRMYEVCSSAHYLVTISICDIICQILHVFYYMKFYWRVHLFDKPELCEFWSIMYMIPLYISEILVLGFTVEKLISLRNPFRSGWFSRNQRAPKEIVWIVVSVTAFSLPQAYFWKVDNKGYCDDNRHDDVMEHPIWIWLTESIIYLVIPTSVVILNFIIIHTAKHSIIRVRHGLNKQVHVRIAERLRESTVVLLELSFFRVLTLVPAAVVENLQQLDYFKPIKLPPVYSVDEVWGNDRWHRFVIYSAISNCLWTVCAARLAFSVIIYSKSSSHFRTELKRIYHNFINEAWTFIRRKLNYNIIVRSED
ncbi:uncharacterized protein LOC132738007 [Ruditapes philippinarum]|uniref:uncharacterized protein LOC132738007 n=1 Tax=Ruditapes philippinarum TaxID=129788 RepID=UPI00295C1774|nr:uncharacterized protein LOC132738007 [Ruditapes philippinarum]